VGRTVEHMAKECWYI